MLCEETNVVVNLFAHSTFCVNSEAIKLLALLALKLNLLQIDRFA